MSLIKMTGKRWMRFHLGVFWFMVALLPPTMTLWVNSVPYIVLMSWTAMAYAAISSYQASRIEKVEDDKMPSGETAMDNGQEENKS